MALFTFVTILISQFSVLFGFNYPNNVNVVITPSVGAYNFKLLRIDETLNLTCSVTTDLPEMHLEWILPGKTTNSQNKVDFISGENWLNMVIRNLQENDSGEYKCVASSNNNPDHMMEKVIRINVKPPKQICRDRDKFQCRSGNCINKRFACDGQIDCKNGEDEDESQCGPDPCKDKRFCNGRCIPASWCCDSSHANCTLRPGSSCCAPLREPPEDVLFNDVTLFQTTVYTVIGCAMAFMFVVTIFIVAICRVHMRRTLMRPMTTSFVSRPRGRPADRFSSLPFYDFDVILNRSNDGMAVNPLLVTYNINNGVQFMGRPVDPPPYCEVVATPPREGPPPPYISVENLATVEEAREENENEEAEEADTLLATRPAPQISIISGSESQSNSNT